MADRLTAPSVFNPTRLVAARHRRAMSRWALATAVDLPSVPALARIETGKKVPDDNLVEAFSTVLNFPIGFFYADDLPTLTADMIS